METPEPPAYREGQRTLHPIQKSNLVNEAYDQLLHMLASGQYPEGSKLPSETQLCEAFGVSRVTVRSAMSKLVALGIVENQQGYGYRVRDMNVGLYANTILPCILAKASELIAVTEFRIGVESTAARLAALRATEEEIQRMRQACEDAGKSRDSWDAFAKYDMAFHHMIANASRNPLFIRTNEMIESMYTVWLTGFQRNHGVERSHEFHQSICEAIARHDPDAAERYMKQHLEDVLGKVIADTERHQAGG
jgi:GntR family transcriptional repressor for pyruvate dehydrogenase complex